MSPAESTQNEFAQCIGELAESFSFNRSVGQIYGLLYISPAPLSLEDIAKRLRMSKGNASINVRALESWGAVRPVWVSGSRRDHYEANRNVKEIALRRLQEGLSKRMDLAEDRFKHLAARIESETPSHEQADVKKRLQELRALLSKGRKILRVAPRFLASGLL
ncbi:MAG: hypothetical protein HY548_07665 [Elusimicrobia bacterium]|nr:hypothetical protein [Elusimicrobiota bacterium]